MNEGEVLLLVEDTDSDIFFFRQAMAKTGVSFPLQAVSDGIEAISYLSGSGPYSDRKNFPPAGLVLLDLKLPKKSGLEVLAWIKSQPSLQGVRVLAFTSSGEEADIRAAYSLGADHYIVKPLGMDKLRDLIQGISEYWNNLASAPDQYLAKFGRSMRQSG